MTRLKRGCLNSWELPGVGTLLSSDMKVKERVLPGSSVPVGTMNKDLMVAKPGFHKEIPHHVPVKRERSTG